MVKLYTPVELPSGKGDLVLSDRIMILGSCFADRIGCKLRDAGFDVCLNPFGTLYNPASVAAALERLESGEQFSRKDCIEMGAGAGLVCSFSHHTSFARADEEQFLANANRALEEASAFWKSCNRLIVTYGTAFVWTRDGKVVANCLKRLPAEFDHKMMDVGQCRAHMERVAEIAGGRKLMLTVSPIRHLAQGAHSNTLSKATLQLASDCLVREGKAEYFPSYEIILDELRDYRFYADDLTHPAPLALEYIWQQVEKHLFTPEAVEASTLCQALQKQLSHRPLHPETEAYKSFLEQTMLKISQICAKFPYLDLKNEQEQCRTQLNRL